MAILEHLKFPTFLWYIERYLAMARTEHPEAYARVSGDPCWRQATLSI